MSSRRLAFALLLAVAALAAACNIGPQPLPPGARDENAGGATLGDAGDVVDPSAADAGSSVATAGEDGGAFSSDAGAPARDAGTDAASDAAVDGSSDAEPDDAGALTNDR